MHIENKRRLASGVSVITIILLTLLASFLLLFGVGNLIRPDVLESALDQNTLVCLMVIFTGLVSIYAILRPLPGGIMLCFSGLVFFVIVIMNPIAGPVIILGLLSIVRSRLVGKKVSQ